MGRLSHASKFGRALVINVMELIYPSCCAACDDPCEPTHWLCEQCKEELDQLEAAECCIRCASPLPQANSPCGRCKGHGLRPFDRIARLSTYELTTRELVHAIKYKHRWATVNHVVDRLAERDSVKSIMRECQVIVPIPMHYFRAVSRGFNQADLIARRLRKRFRAPVIHALRRRRSTASQTVFHSREARIKNMRDVFELIDDDSLRGKRVVLVDDVMTSGATLRSAAREIRKAKPARIDAVVIATANPLKSDLTAI